MIRAVAMLIILALGGTATAQTQDTDIRDQADRVTGEALLDAYLGVTHEGSYNFGADGVPRDAYTELHREDGTTRYREGEIDTQGAWLIRGDDLLCFAYSELGMSGGCFRVYRVGTCYYYYSTQIPLLPGEVDRNYWTARSVRAGDQATCEALLS